MAATINPHRMHQLASEPRASEPRHDERAARPALHPIDGGRSPAARQRRRTYRRRRVVAVVAVVTIAVLVWQGVSGIVGLLAEPAPSLPPLRAGAAKPAAAPISGATYVVQPGDTLWAIARRVAPGRDPRAVVDELSRRLDGAPLRAGQRLELTSLS
ncbi:MAG: LysM peptidoglycan-binding domain-containing protein [Actinobacteria bacterium]|nr:LysM peptidoglycan-binding domain-containing protein [Actinomycetota bacterium]